MFVDLGGRNQGVVPLRQFEEPPAEGGELELLVVRFNADEGLYELSRPTAAVDVGNWDEVREGQIVEVTVTGSNKGGLECQSPISAASFRWGRFRSTAWKTRKSSSASGWRASSRKRIAIAATWS